MNWSTTRSLVLAGLLCGAAFPSAAQDEPTPAAPAQAVTLPDAAIEKHRVRLLKTGFEAVTKMPVSPHIKPRSRGQERVVAACFELEQPALALGFIEEIDNWRRGAGYADYAYYLVEHGVTEGFEAYLDRARHVAKTDEGAQLQKWRHDRVLSKIARVRVALGQIDEAIEIEADVEPSEAGVVRRTYAKQLTPEEFASQIETLTVVLETGDFDSIKGAMEALAELFNRFYDDEERRQQVEDLLGANWRRAARQIGIEIQLRMIGYALGHEDLPKALEMVNAVSVAMDEAKWLPRTEIPLRAAITRSRWLAGDHELARTEARALREQYDAARDGMVNIWRASALRPLAECFVTMGDLESARAVYALALGEGVVNPNSRPRAEDLAATCTSMALNGFAPDEEMWKRIDEINDALDHPW